MHSHTPTDTAHQTHEYQAHSVLKKKKKTASASRQENHVTVPVNPSESCPNKTTETSTSSDPESTRFHQNLALN